MDIHNINRSEIHAKWISWYCFGRLERITRDVDHMYKPGEVWDINEVLFRRGMAIEASWIARLVGWAAIWRIDISDSLRAAYTRLIGASNGTLSLDDSILMGEDVEDIILKLHISDEDKEEFYDLEQTICGAFPPPPSWWIYLKPEGHDTAASRRVAREVELHVDYARALEYSRSSPDFGQAVVDERTRELLAFINKADIALRALGVDQEDQLRVLNNLISSEHRGLLTTFLAAFPGAPLTEEEKDMLAGAASTAGPARTDEGAAGPPQRPPSPSFAHDTPPPLFL
ncbi:hypothetical protein PENSPDRAFT_694910 [Peniophora sp. CONT]|nr:hypothetical protein PENSPDRAFT_694910 [Peniophora sp. CONT]